MPRSSFSFLLLFASLCLLNLPARAQLSVTANLPNYVAEFNPSPIAADPVANRVYFMNETEVTVLDGDTNERLATYPFGGTTLAVDPVIGRLYIVQGETLTVLNTGDGTVQAQIQIPRSNPNIAYLRVWPLKLDAVHHRLFLGTSECIEDTNCSYSLRLMDGQDYTTLKVLDHATSDFDYDPGQDRVYLNGLQPKTLTVMDGGLNTVLASVPLEDRFYGMIVDPARQRIYFRSGSPASMMIVMDQNDYHIIAKVGISDVIGCSIDSNTGDLYLLSLWTGDPIVQAKRQVHRWDGVSVDSNGGAALSGTLSFPELFELQGVNPATGRVYGHTYGLQSLLKTVVMEPVLPADTIPPTVTATLERAPDYGEWYKTRVKVKVSAVDNTGGSGIYYLVLPNSTVDYPDLKRRAFGNEANATISLPLVDEQSTTVQFDYSAVDVAQNKTLGTLTVKIDHSPPKTTAQLTADPGGIPRITLTATDLASGVESTFYRVDDGPEQTYTGPFTLNPNGPHEVTYFSRDHIGFEEEKKTISTYLPGDLDNDGEATIGDAVLLLQYVTTGHSAIDMPLQVFVAGDLDGNAEINVSDVVALLRKLVGL